MKRLMFSFILSMILFIYSNWNITFSNPNETIENEPYRKLEDLKEELKEERKKIDQQRFEEVRLKEEEKKAKEEEKTEVEPNNDKQPKNTSEILKKESSDIPTLIVRLRGKHSKKYLCSYNFVISDENTESVLESCNIDDYKMLMKKTSLKVRSGEVINFEFSEKPKSIEVFIWGDEIEKIDIKRGTIRVPDVDKKIVLGIDGKYKNGSVRYAVVLDVRK